MKRYVFIGSVQYSAYCLNVLLEMGINIVSIMCTDKESSKINSDYFDLGHVAEKHGKYVYYFKKISDEYGHIREYNPDVILILGFSQIIPKRILEIPTIGCIGSHPALLPRNRGRHPIIWAIANGLRKSGITLFWIDEGVDSGDIWTQKEFEIDEFDNASSIYQKVEELTVDLFRKNIPELENGIVKRIKQDESKANYCRKRTYKDGEIDWRMSSKRIYDLVRALYKPYVGAHCIYKGKEIKIWKVNILDLDEGLESIEPGKVLFKTGSSIQVKTGDGLIDIVVHEFGQIPEIGEYL